MTTSFTCSSCGFRFRVEDRFLGRSTICPCKDCDHRIHLVAETEKPAGRSKHQSARRSKRTRGAGTVSGTGNGRNSPGDQQRSASRNSPTTASRRSSHQQQEKSTTERRPKRQPKQRSGSSGRNVSLFSSPSAVGIVSFVLVLAVGGTGIGIWKFVIASESNPTQSTAVGNDHTESRYVPVGLKNAESAAAVIELEKEKASSPEVAG